MAIIASNIYDNTQRRYISLDLHCFVESRCAFAAQGLGSARTIDSSPIVFESVNLNSCNGYDVSTGKPISGIQNTR